MKNKKKLKWLGAGFGFVGALTTAIAIPLSVKRQNKNIIENKELTINAELANNVVNPILNWVKSTTETEFTNYLQNTDYCEQLKQWIANLLNIDQIYLSNISLSHDNNGPLITISPSSYLTFILSEDTSGSGLGISLNENGELEIYNLSFALSINVTQNNLNLFASNLRQRISKAKISQNYFMNHVNTESAYYNIYEAFVTNNSGIPIEIYDNIQEITAINNVVTIVPKQGCKFELVSSNYLNNDVVIEDGCIVINNVDFTSVVDANIINLNYRSLIPVYNKIANQVITSNINNAITSINEPTNQTQIINLFANAIGCSPTHIDKILITNVGDLVVEPANGYEFKLNDDISNNNSFFNECVFDTIKLLDISNNLCFSCLTFQRDNTIIIDLEKYNNLNNLIDSANFPPNPTPSLINELLKQDNAKEKIANCLNVDPSLIDDVIFEGDKYSSSSWYLNINFSKNYSIVYSNSSIDIDAPQMAAPAPLIGRKNTISFYMHGFFNIYNSIDINKLSQQISKITYTNGGGVFNKENFEKSPSQINGYDGGILKNKWSSYYSEEQYYEFCKLIGLDIPNDITIKIFVDSNNDFNIIINSSTQWSKTINWGNKGTGSINGRELIYKQHLNNLTPATNVDISFKSDAQHCFLNSLEFLKFNNAQEIENSINEPQNIQTFLNALTERPNNIQANQIQKIEIRNNSWYNGWAKNNNIYETYDIAIIPKEGINLNLLNSPNFTFKNLSYLLLENFIFAKTNRIAIDEQNIINLVQNYNKGTSLLNNPMYFNNDGSVKQEYLFEFVKNLLYINVEQPNTRDDLFTIVPDLKNAFESFKISTTGKNSYSGYLELRIDIQPNSNYVLLPSHYPQSTYGFTNNKLVSYIIQLPSIVNVDSSNLQKLANSIRNYFVNGYENNVLIFLNDSSYDYYYQREIKDQIYKLLSPNEFGNLRNADVVFEYNKKAKKLIIKSNNGLFFKLVPNESIQLVDVTITSDGNIEIDNVVFSESNPNNININNFIDLRQRMLNFINENPDSNWYNLPNLMIKDWKQICEYIGIKEWYMLDEISTIWADYGIFIDLEDIKLNLTPEQKQQLADANIEYSEYAHGNIFNINYIQPGYQKP